MSAEKPQITLVIDGIEVEAEEGAMLVDAAKGGDIEIPVFCYEPKLGGPVGACRMCLVEIEGIPKLQTGCSTAVRDGMVVYTRTDRVIESQNAIVEFLLVNHPLDCPVCDKGGECPLQDISMGWGPGRSRFSEPKRHFQKPVALSPLVRIDRERCIMCYRCVRFSQDVAEDEQLQLLERGAQSFVGTFDERPYIAPFAGNIIDLCPVGALTSEAYRFRARPWDIEDSGSICTLCPSQCNVMFTVRDERVQRVFPRDNDDVDNGWLCDKGRFGFQMIASGERITEPTVSGAKVGWEAALDAAAERLRAAGERTAVIVGGQASNEEGYLAQRIARRALGSPHVGAVDELSPAPLHALSAPELGAAVADIDHADSILVVGVDPLHAMPVLDLRLRKAVRHGDTRLVVASDRPTALDGGAEVTARYEPGEAAELLEALERQLTRPPANPGTPGREAEDVPGIGSAGREAEEVPGGDSGAESIAGELRPGATVIVYGERVGRGTGGEAALHALAGCARALRCDADRAGLIGVPDGANGRGLREVGCLSGAGPGFEEAAAGRDLAEIRDGLRAGDVDALILVQADPVRDLPDGPAWAQALRQARAVIAISCFEDASTAAADIVLPAEMYAEKEGTLTHPDGRLQRLRPSVPRPGDVRPVWQALTELSARLDHETGIDSASEALEAIAAEVPFYAGVTADEIGGRGVRWQERQAAAACPPAAEARGERRAAAADSGRPENGSGGGALRLGTYRDLWAAEATERNPAIRFLAPAQRVELAPADGARLGLGDGDQVEVRSNGTSVRARVALHERIRPGAAFMIEGTATENANALAGAETVEIERIAPAPGAPGRSDRSDAEPAGS
ncbi:MAG: NADH-quinone oxidoreductase subunit NuoG [Solirubrobacterales bacterium]|nr:NADH-quinone oxidoreductase subunit NuoG [Solirubrobacterales bacterium]